MKIKNLLWKFLKFGLVPLLALIVVATIVGSAYFFYQRGQTSKNFAIDGPDGIVALEQVTLGGLEQWISIRGQDRNNPVLLFLHGGPGWPEMVPVRHYNHELEKHFVVVNWDQRGAGKSFSPHISPEELSLDIIVNDTLELTRKLQERFETERVFLAGHSWGSIVGVHAARLHPEYYYAYIGIGQGVDFVEAEKISYQFTLDKAYQLNNTKAIQQLESIGSPPYERDQLIVQRSWLFEFGGEVYGETSKARHIIDLFYIMLSAPEYSFRDVFNMVRGNNMSGEVMWSDLMETNLIEQAPRLQVPVYFLTGRYDYVTVFEKIEEYYELLEAPHKELIWFEHSAHSPLYEEPEKFVRVMTEILWQIK